jgi:protein-tyrosine phosphatase
MTEKTATIEGTYNFRDVGGLPIAGGGETRGGVLFRSDALGGLTPGGIAAFDATPIGVVVDLRIPHERETRPDRLPETRAFEIVELPLTSGSLTGLARAAAEEPELAAEAVEKVLAEMPTVGDMYLVLLERGGPAFVEIARRIAASHDDAPSAVLVHCTAGKDRTGVSVAIMLDAVGVERTAIVANYAETEGNLAGRWASGMIASVEKLGIPVTDGIRAILTASPAEAMEQTLAWLDAHGGSAAYLQHHGLSDEDLAALRRRLVA